MKNSPSPRVCIGNGVMGGDTFFSSLKKHSEYPVAASNEVLKGLVDCRLPITYRSGAIYACKDESNLAIVKWNEWGQANI